ncbi:MAG TPA: hypothetical protein VEB63_09320 [Chitinophagaceae bacterium]|nr:hypothetical protein [Chitinophagaceae bacterium]
MKKIFLSVLLLSSACALSAQEVTIYRLGTTTANPGYSVPMHIRTSFEVTNPNITVVTWEPLRDWWVASYMENNRVMHVYFNPAGESFNVALPVLQTFVPDAVINTALSRFGNAVYDIARMKGANHDELYVVRLLESGTARSVWMDANGTEVTDVFIVHTANDTRLKPDVDDREMEKDEQELKIKTEDKKTKVKTDDEKTKVKTEDQKIKTKHDDKHQH